MRVLHVIPSVSPVHGGPSTAIWSVLDSLQREGIHADLATTDDDGPGRRLDVLLGRPVEERGHRVLYFRRQADFYQPSLPLLRWLAAHVADYDLVHSHGGYSFAPAAAGWCARARRVPYAVSPHGVLNRWGRTQRRPRAKQVSLRLLEGRLLRDAAFVHYTSPAEEAQARELGIPHRPLVAPLGIDLATIPPHRLRSPASSPPTVLFLSRIAPIKQLDRLIAAIALVARRIPEVRLLVAGDGPVELVAALQRLAVELGVERRVDWLGFVRDEARERAFAEAWVLAQPSASENFGMAATEALARGLPVVVTTGVGIAPYVAAVGAGLVCSDAADDLSACILRVLGDPSAAAAMGRAGRRVVAEELSTEALGRSLARAYRAAAAGSAASREVGAT